MNCFVHQPYFPLTGKKENNTKGILPMENQWCQILPDCANVNPHLTKISTPLLNFFGLQYLTVIFLGKRYTRSYFSQYLQCIPYIYQILYQIIVPIPFIRSFQTALDSLFPCGTRQSFIISKQLVYFKSFVNTSRLSSSFIRDKLDLLFIAACT